MFGNFITDDRQLSVFAQATSITSLTKSASNSTIDVVIASDVQTKQVFKYTRTGSVWNTPTELIWGGASDDFGASSDIADDGVNIVVGAPAYDYSTPEGLANNSGGVKFFGASEQVVIPSTPFDYQFFGSEVCMSGNGIYTVVSNSPAFAHDMYVFKLDGTWTERQKIPFPTGHYYIAKLKLNYDGSQLAMSCRVDIDGVKYYPVNIYSRVGETWSFTQTIFSPHGTENGWGQDMDFSNDGNTLVIRSNQHRVYIYNKSGSLWVQQDSIYLNLARYVSISANNDLLIGTAQYLSLYKKRGDDWSLRQTFGDGTVMGGDIRLSDDGLSALAGSYFISSDVFTY